MKVYVVMGGWDYEGYSELGMKTFSDKMKAEAYAKSLEEEEMPFNYVSVFEMEVE